MFRSIFILTSALLLAVLVSCSDNAPAPTESAPTFLSASPNQFILGYGDSAILEPDGLQVTFSQLVSDSRCPIGVNCFWEGEAQIGLEVIDEPGSTHFVVLPIRGLGGLPINVDTLGYRFCLCRLDPYPVYPDSIRVEDYEATLAISPFVPALSADSEVKIVNTNPLDLQVDWWGLEEFAIDSHIVTIGLNHSGGCGEHDFDLFMTPAAFMESYPVQANLYLRHIDHDDPCDAIVNRQVAFDIRPVLSLYQLGYGQLDPIWLHLYEYYEGSSPVRRLSVLYQPDADESAIAVPEHAPGQ